MDPFLNLYPYSPLLAHVSLAYWPAAFSAVIMRAVAILNLLGSPLSRRLKSLHCVSDLRYVVYLLNSFERNLFGIGNADETSRPL